MRKQERMDATKGYEYNLFADQLCDILGFDRDRTNQDALLKEIKRLKHPDRSGIVVREALGLVPETSDIMVAEEIRQLRQAWAGTSSWYTGVNRALGHGDERSKSFSDCINEIHRLREAWPNEAKNLGRTEVLRELTDLLVDKDSETKPLWHLTGIIKQIAEARDNYRSQIAPLEQQRDAQIARNGELGDQIDKLANVQEEAVDRFTEGVAKIEFHDEQHAKEDHVEFEAPQGGAVFELGESTKIEIIETPAERLLLGLLVRLTEKLDESGPNESYDLLDAIVKNLLKEISTK